MSKKTNLPEYKNYNITELAKKWNCDPERILRYILDNMLIAYNPVIEAGESCYDFVGDQYGWEIPLASIIAFEEKYNLFQMAGEDNQDEVSPKTRNSYLRLIRVLCDYTIDGLTGIPHKDAEAVIRAIEGKGKECPVKSAALAKYLKDAEEL